MKDIINKDKEAQDKKDYKGYILRKRILIAIFIFVVGFIVYGTDWGFLRSRITDYPAYCDKKIEEGNCPGKITIMSFPTTYEVSKKRQEVIYWQPGESDSINKATDCIIKDRKNWSCKLDGEKFGFSKGKYWNSYREGAGIFITGQDFSLSRREWLELKWRP
ncbi:MAG: hypothetical protein NTY12_02735 [Candidatus Falkowbacteria bacterium]|nr:hypothetical protein [Candidatus Falkowbacteria bacterium]